MSQMIQKLNQKTDSMAIDAVVNAAEDAALAAASVAVPTGSVVLPTFILIEGVNLLAPF